MTHTLLTVSVSILFLLKLVNYFISCRVILFILVSVLEGGWLVHVHWWIQLLVACMKVYELRKVIQSTWCLFYWAFRLLFPWLCLFKSSIWMVWMVTCTGSPLKGYRTERSLFFLRHGLVNWMSHWLQRLMRDGLTSKVHVYLGSSQSAAITLPRASLIHILWAVVTFQIWICLTVKFSLWSESRWRLVQRWNLPLHGTACRYVHISLDHILFIVLTGIDSLRRLHPAKVIYMTTLATVVILISSLLLCLVSVAILLHKVRGLVLLLLGTIGVKGIGNVLILLPLIIRSTLFPLHYLYVHTLVVYF